MPKIGAARPPGGSDPDQPNIGAPSSPIWSCAGSAPPAGWGVTVRPEPGGRAAGGGSAVGACTGCVSGRWGGGHNTAGQEQENAGKEIFGSALKPPAVPLAPPPASVPPPVCPPPAQACHAPPGEVAAVFSASGDPLCTERQTSAPCVVSIKTPFPPQDNWRAGSSSERRSEAAERPTSRPAALPIPPKPHPHSALSR